MTNPQDPRPRTRELALRAEHLRKEFTIHTRQASSLKEMVVKNLLSRGETSQYIALRDLSFELPKGRSLAVIGANGSGKSTLLKLASGLSDPTSGTIDVDGRLVGLLELGAGFQPEFTGMENIFLQCAVMGLTREQTLERLDAIVAFSELDRFIHTPVKRYSSGMFVRLGFAIAAHADADIVLLDEVLSVGDLAFQEKCLRRMRAMHRSGKTIVFVSHILEQVEAVADLVLWLHKGEALAFGTAEDVLPQYYEAMQRGTTSDTSQIAHDDGRVMAAVPSGRIAARDARIAAIAILGADGAERRSFRLGEPIVIRLGVEASRPLPFVDVCIMLGTLDGIRALWITSGEHFAGIEPGEHTFEVQLDGMHLAPGRYLVNFMLGEPGRPGFAYDMVLRQYAISLHRERRRDALEEDEGRMVPWGEWRSA